LIKPSDSSNANGILFLRDGLNEKLEQAFENPRKLLLQRAVHSKLIGGRKFHVRALCLITGNVSVFLRREPRVLVATLPPDGPSYFGHITNRGFNIKHQAYEEEKQNLSLSQAFSDQYEFFFGQMISILAGLFAVLENEPKYFFPLQNCFEMLGIDFMIDTDDRVQLIEANPNPSINSLKGITREELVGPNPIEEVDIESWIPVYSKTS